MKTSNIQKTTQDVYYGVDLGSKKFWVAVRGELGKPYSIEDFLSFNWYVGPGVLITENTSLHARPQSKTASLAQYLTFSQIKSFLLGCNSRGIQVRVHPNKHTWKSTRLFLDKIKQNDPIISDWSHIDTDKYKCDSKGKYKSDELEAAVLAFLGQHMSETTSPLYEVRNPDADWDFTSKIKHEVINTSNRLLNNHRITNKYDDPYFSKLRDLLPAIEQAVMTSNEPGAVVLRNIEAFPLPRASRESEKHGYSKGDIKLHEITPALKAVWSCRVSESGRLYKFGLQMLWKALGGSPYRFRSGVAGAQLWYDVHKEIRRFRFTEAGLPVPGKNETHRSLTRDVNDPYYAARIQSHKDLRNVVKFLNKTFEDLLQ